MFTTREILIEGHKLVARFSNDDKPGHPIILLHGITSSVDSWISDELIYTRNEGSKTELPPLHTRPFNKLC